MRRRYIAAHIPGARFVELAGDNHVPLFDPDQVLDEVEEFLTGVRPVLRPTACWRRSPSRISSAPPRRPTPSATLRGRRSSRRITRPFGELDRFAGEEIDTAGDGFFAVFDGPARAIRCALGIREALRPLDLEVRAGVHTGEVERPADDKPRGIAVHVGRASCRSRARARCS